MNIESWIRRQQRALTEIYDLSARARRAEAILSEIPAKERSALRIRDKIAPKLAETETISKSTAGHDGWDWALGAAGVFVADVGAWYITRRSSMPDLSVLEAFVVSFVAAGLLALLFHSVARLGLTVRFNADATIRRHRLAGWITGGIAVISGLWILISSYLAPELLKAVLTLGWVPFIGLNIGGPGCAGVCSSAAWYLLKPEILKDKHARANEALSALAAFRGWLEAQIRSAERRTEGQPERPPRRRRPFRQADRQNDEAKPGRPPRNRSSSPGMKVVTSVFLGLVLLGGVATEGAEPDEAVMVGSEVVQSQHDTCAVFTDATATVNDEARRLANDFLERTLWSMLEEYDCARVVAGTFTDDGAWTERTWFDPVPIAPASLDCSTRFAKPEVDCSTTEPEPLEGMLRGYERFGNVQELLKGEAIEACEEEQQDREAGRLEKLSACRVEERQRNEMYEAARASFARGVRAALEVAEPETNTTTEITPLLKSLVTANRIRVVVLITDALDSGWQKSKDLPPIVVPAQRDVVMLVTDPDEEYAHYDKVLRAVEAWRLAIPNVVVVLTSELHEGLWHGLSRGRP